MQVFRRRLDLLRTRDILRTGLTDVAHRERNLVDTHQLLLRRSGNLDRRLRRLCDAV